jgi:hypothetical protein
VAFKACRPALTYRKAINNWVWYRDLHASGGACFHEVICHRCSHAPFLSSQVDVNTGAKASRTRHALATSTLTLILTGADSPNGHAVEEPIPNDQRMEQHGSEVGQKR